MKVRETLCALVLGLVLGCSRGRHSDPYPGFAWGSPESVAVGRGFHCSPIASSRVCTAPSQFAGVNVTAGLWYGEAGLRNVYVEAPPGDFIALKALFDQKYGRSHIVEKIVAGTSHKLLEWDSETTNVILENVGSEAIAVLSPKDGAEVKP